MGGLFGVPWMLWWGLAAAIPILIHLFARQRYRRVQWAAMEWLLLAFKKTRKRIRLEQILLLLLRILAILLFIGALAEPLLKSSGLLSGGDERREVVLVLDDSFSMGVKEADGTTSFSRAREQALRLVRSLKNDRSDSVTIVTAGKPAVLRLKPTDDLERAAAELEKLELGDGATDYLGAFQTVVATLDELKPGAEIYLLSDLQKSAFQPPSEIAAAHETSKSAPLVKDQSQQVLSSFFQQIKAKKARLSFVAPRESTTDNLAVTAMDRTDRAAILGAPTRVSATIRNFGARPQRGVVHLYADGGTQPVDFKDLEAIPPGATSVVDFRHTFLTAGSHNLEARFVTDALETDNRRALAMDVREKIRVLLVDGDPKSEPGEAESFFVASALDPGAEGARSAFQLETVDETAFERSELSGIDLVVLLNVGLISRKRSEELQRFVEAGGGLLVYLGERVDAGTMNAQLWKGGAGVLPAELGEILGKSQGSAPAFTMVGPELSHPALRYFDDPQVLTWLTLPPIYNFFQLKVAPEAKDTRILAKANRLEAGLPKPEPILIEKAMGKGKTILFASSGDQEWNDIPAYPTYVLLTRELAYYLTRREARLENLLVGDAYQRTLRTFVQEVILSRDGEQREVLRPLSLGEELGSELRTSALDRAGVYRLDLSGQADSQKKEPTPIFVAVNVDTAESDLSRVGEEWIMATFPGEIVNWLSELGDSARSDGPADQGRTWWWVLLIALVCLLLETALSQIFGLRSRGGTA